MSRPVPALLIALLVVAVAVPAIALDDHLQCFQIKDPLNLAAVVDLNSPLLGLAPGCKVSTTKFFCVPVAKIVVSAEDKKTHVPIVPFPIDGANPGKRLCYKVKCPTAAIPDQAVSDQFGNRVVAKLKTSLLCTPAEAVTSPDRFVDNGDGTITDNATGLQWEKKDGADGMASSANHHDVDNTYAWDDFVTPGAGGGGFLDVLNDCRSADGVTTTGGFAGHCDWRLPSLAELKSILLEPEPCGTSPCIDPTFGPTFAGMYWSATNHDPGIGVTWVVTFTDGNDFLALRTAPQHARAVRVAF
jgi:hypothetical protein